MSAQNAETVAPRSPRQRWGTCCPYDPECEHSFLDDAALTRWMDTPISDEVAYEYAGQFGMLW